MTFSMRDLLHLVGCGCIAGGAGFQWGLAAGVLALGVALVVSTLAAR